MKAIILLLALLIPSLCYGDWPGQHMETLKDGTIIVVAESDSGWHAPDSYVVYKWSGKQSNYHWVDKGRTKKYPYGYWQWERKPLTIEELKLEELKKQTRELVKIRKLLNEIRMRAFTDTLIGGK